MRIFVSSTYTDLVDHRRTVEESLALCNVAYNAMEHFGAVPSPPLATCLQAVDQCDAFIGIVGVRYGSAPPGSKLSFTEREYRRARKNGIPILIFLLDMDRALVPPAHAAGETGEQKRRLDRFKAAVTKSHTVTYFTTPEDLSRRVLASVIKELKRFL